MTFNNLPTALLGLALIALLGGCCTSGTCGSGSCSSDQVYSAPSTPEPASDCGCECSVASDSQVSYDSSGTVVSSDEFYSPSETPTLVGESASSVSSPTPIIDAPTVGETSGFTAESASESNALPGNLLPGN